MPPGNSTLKHIGQGCIGCTACVFGLPLLFAYPTAATVVLATAFGLTLTGWLAKQVWPTVPAGVAANTGAVAGSPFMTAPMLAATWPQATNPAPGATTLAAVTRLAAAAHARQKALDSLSQQLRAKQRLLPVYKFGILSARAVLALRSFATNAFPLGRPACWFVMAASATALGIMAMAVASLEGGRLFAGGFCGAIFGALLTTAMIYVPGDEFWTKLLDLDRKKLTDLTHFVQQLGQQVAEATRLHEEAHEAWQRALTAFQSRLNQLLLCDWRCLRGIPFEEFLQELFEAHGYHVETTKASGDQGVDLLVTYGAERIAVQVKGYANNVGNEAVQQAFTGMAFYGCQRCAVVTNSTFTSAARDVALKLRVCTLIDGSQIDALIRGNVRI